MWQTFPTHADVDAVDFEKCGSIVARVGKDGGPDVSRLCGKHFPPTLMLVMTQTLSTAAATLQGLERKRPCMLVDYATKQS